MNTVLFHSARMLALVTTAMSIGGCVKEPAPAPPSTPLVEQRAADPAVAAVEEFRGSFAPGGIEADYRATFSAGQIHTLEETRKATSRTGIYEFRGARLIGYHGAAVGSEGTIELEFDARGKLLSARAGDKDVSPEEVSAISDRAQSLRSHAVAQHAVQGHDRN